MKSAKNKMTGMGIGKRLIIGFLVTALLGSLSGIISAVSLRSMNNSYDHALKNFGFAQGDIGNAMTAMARMSASVRDVIGFTDQSDIRDAQASFKENQTKYESTIATVKQTLQTDVEEQQMTAVENAYGNWLSEAQSIMQNGQSTDPTATSHAQRQMVDNLDPLYDTMYQAWVTMMNAKSDNGTSLNDSLTTRSTVLMIIAVVLILAALGCGIAIALSLSKGITGPIDVCVKRLAGLAEQGDLDTPVPEATTNDEIGTLLGSMGEAVTTIRAVIKDMGFVLGEMSNGNFNVRSNNPEVYVGDYGVLLGNLKKLAIDMSDTMSQIEVSADQVNSGSDQVSSGSQALAQGAAEQASSSEELAATIDDISVQVEKSSKNADIASKKAIGSAEQMAALKAQMETLTDAMNEISNSSQEIGKIIGNIENIAFQTNILALNAAVEAARAGEAGKGFAVVADEVRNLATKTAESSRGTSTLIERSMAEVKNGMKIAGETAAALSDAVDEVKAVSDLIEEISATSETQSNAVQQIKVGMDQISAVVQTNSATAEESAAASEELSGQAELLKGLVNKFTLRKEGVTSGTAKANAAIAKQESKHHHESTPAKAESTASHVEHHAGDKY